MVLDVVPWMRGQADRNIRSGRGSREESRLAGNMGKLGAPSCSGRDGDSSTDVVERKEAGVGRMLVSESMHGATNEQGDRR